MKTVKIFYGVSWIIEKRAISEKEMTYLKRTKDELKIAEIMREKTKLLVKNILDGGLNEDLMFVYKKRFIIATPPRLYQQWIYDCAKSDIIAWSAIEDREKCIRAFKKQKNIAVSEKARLPAYLNRIKPTLNTLYSKGLIDGVIGRGSYFDRNGFPSARDDVDFILLRIKPETKQDRNAFMMTLKKARAVKINIVEEEERNINKVKKGKVVSLILVSRDPEGLGTAYEKYVLLNGPGIPLRNLSKEKSEKLARRLISYLPKKDIRKLRKIPKLPPKK